MKLTGKKPLRASRLMQLVLRIVVLLPLMSLQGCYYMQAASGQFELWRKQRPVPEVVADPQTPDELAERLQLLQRAREFATTTLMLPDNGSYRQYADLGREFVLWNVVAAPEFSLQPYRWCYLIVGCVAYRGYFRQQKAEAYASRLRRRGFDVFVGGVPAYSTLGRFSDPLLNTMMSRGDAELISLLFHELAHQRLYIDDDTGFNESFASAVAEFGVQQWFEQSGDTTPAARLRAYQAQTSGFMDLINATRDKLQTLYAQDLDAATMRAEKAQLLNALADQLRGRWRGDWSAEQLNNARLATFSLYHGDLPAFRTMFADCNRDWACFYEAAADVAALAPVPRRAALAALAQRAPQAP